MTIFKPFEGVKYYLFFGEYDAGERFDTKEALLRNIDSYQPVYGVMQVEWNDVLQQAQWHDVSEAIASEWVALHYDDLLDDDGNIHSNIDPFFENEARRVHRYSPQQVSA